MPSSRTKLRRLPHAPAEASDAPRPHRLGKRREPPPPPGYLGPPHRPDQPGIGGAEVGAPRDAGLVPEQLDRGMAPPDPRRDGLDLVAVADVAGLRPGADPRRDLAQPLLA